MKKYVFSHISFFDNILTSKVVESDLDVLTVATEEFAGRQDLILLVKVLKILMILSALHLIAMQ